jgi:DNA-binding transcriptional ArsR family regulator
VTTNQGEHLAALGDPTRRAIFEMLATAGPLPVGDLASRLPVSRPAVSQHLKVLKDAGLVVDRPAGTRRLYQLNPEGIDALRVWLDGVWTAALGAFKAVVQYDPGPEKASRVDVRFVAEDDRTTRVELEHSNLDRHGTDWPQLQAGISNPEGGWPGLLLGFAKAAQ